MLVVRVVLAVMLICLLWSPGLTGRSERPERPKRPDSPPGNSDRPERPKRHSHVFTVGINDDTLLNEVAKQRREKRLGVAPDIPALTDATFPAIVYNPNTSLVVVLFYLPFDPVGTLFLQQYQLAGKQLAALKGGHSSSRHPLVRVNCHDWTDVCRKENITTYPVIHLYQQGKWRQRYRDALDKDVLVRTVFLLQCGQPLWLRTEEEVRQFLDGHLPYRAHHLMVDNLVILKPSDSLTEVEAFTEVARELRTQMLFAIVSPDVHTPLIGIEVGVLHVRRDEQYQPYDTLTHSLDTPTIRRFLRTGKFQLLPELTFLNFPELSSRPHPLGILFVRPTDWDVALHRRAVVDVIRSGRVHNVTFCSMAVDDDNPMADTLLRTYTGHRPLPSFVIVDLHKRTVFTFIKWELTDTNLILWILGIQAGKIPPTSHLTRGQWGPASRHIDFLGKMDRDRERKEKTDKRDNINSPDEEHFPHSEKIGRFPLPATEEEDHENQNQHHHHQIQPGIHHRQNQDHHRGYQNQHERNRNQNQNSHNQNEHEENGDPRSQQKQNRHERSQNQHDDRNEIAYDYSWKQDDELNQNRHRNRDEDKHRRPKTNQNKLNQNQPHPRDHNQHDPNQKRHRKNQNENQQNLNKNEHRPNQHTRHEAPKSKHAAKMRLSVHEGQLASDSGYKKRSRESLPARTDSDSRTSSQDTGSLNPDKDKDGEGRLLHTEL